jgi:hypothetical protein
MKVDRSMLTLHVRRALRRMDRRRKELLASQRDEPTGEESMSFDDKLWDILVDLNAGLTVSQTMEAVKALICAELLSEQVL